MSYGRPDYDQRTPFAAIPDNEPVFVIRGQDRAAPEALRAYAQLAKRNGAAHDLVLSVLHHADEMERFQQVHGSKVPDLSPQE